jgi:multimeric flavodoxin WrbA
MSEENISENKHLLIVAHQPSANTRTLTEAVLRGASHEDIAGVEVRVIVPLQAQAADVLWAHAVILGTTENFGYMSGAMKDFFDRIYYPCLEHTEGKPNALFIRAGNDGSGARRSIERIVTGLRWKAVCDPVIAAKDFKTDYIEQCEELGMTLAVGLEAGVF